ncbi:MAG: sodium:proton antiporter [Lachnospiraceae bacterium]|nr:sodium:proton antiporter [Lachnospiraceae bacterium]
MEQVCDNFLTVVLIVLGILCFFCLIRSVKGPRIADRIVAVNMIGTMTMMGIAVLTVKLKEGFLADVALIYAMISFLAVVVVTKVYMGVYREKTEAGKKKKGE